MATPPTPPAGKPRPEDFETWWSYRQAERVWLRGHGGYVWTTLAIAVVFGALSGSAVAFVLLIVVALLGTAYARSRP